MVVRQTPDGDGPGDNEIWPGPLTANRGGNASGRTDVGAVADATAASIVVHAPGERGLVMVCFTLPSFDVGTRVHAFVVPTTPPRWLVDLGGSMREVDARSGSVIR